MRCPCICWYDVYRLIKVGDNHMIDVHDSNIDVFYDRTDFVHMDKLFEVSN